jgi:hypothetical protein
MTDWDDGGMRLLDLGGTRFIGHAVVTAALEQGWEVTTFNRGVSGPDEAGVVAVRGDRAEASDLALLTSSGLTCGKSELRPEARSRLSATDRSHQPADLAYR